MKTATISVNHSHLFQNILIPALFLAFASGLASASNITAYIGVDDGAPITGPFPASMLAQSQFETAATGISPLTTITFEDLSVGFSNSFTAAPGVTVDVNAPNLGVGVSGISNVNVLNTNGFNITQNGSQWFGFPQGSATFNFATPTQSFGFWITGVQAAMLSSLTVSFNDGQPELLDLPITTNGGTAFFGFVDPGSPISAITISGVGTDLWGIDDVTYNGTSNLVLPEPSSLLLLGSGAAAALRLRRLKQRRHSEA